MTAETSLMARGRHLLPALSQTEQEKFDAPQTRRVAYNSTVPHGSGTTVISRIESFFYAKC